MVGDIVNLSARLMAAAKTRGGLLCDADTVENCKESSIHFVELERVRKIHQNNENPKCQTVKKLNSLFFKKITFLFLLNLLIFR